MGMYRIGFEGDSELIFRLFADCDTDQSGIIGIDELYAFMNGRHTNTTRARELTLRRMGEDDDYYTKLEWSPTVLRGELQRLLMQFGFVPLDLLRAWDKSGDGKFTGVSLPTPVTAASALLLVRSPELAPVCDGVHAPPSVLPHRPPPEKHLLLLGPA